MSSDPHKELEIGSSSLDRLRWTSAAMQRRLDTTKEDEIIRASKGDFHCYTESCRPFGIVPLSVSSYYTRLEKLGS